MDRLPEAQFATLLERVDHIVKSIDELRPDVKRVAEIRKDINHISSETTHLSTLIAMQQTAIHQNDKRLALLEWWQKGMIAFSAVAFSVLMTVAGYLKNYVDLQSNTQNDTRDRLAAIEFYINSPNFEAAMRNGRRAVVEGGKD